MQQLPFSTLAPKNFSERKEIFLRKYKSPSGKIQYKRYVGSPLRYAGGKSLAVGLIVELLPNNIKKIVSPFFGGGSVEIACALDLGLPVIGYDIFNILINYWDIQIRKPQELYDRLQKFNPTREEFKKVKDIIKLHWDNKEKIKSTYDLAALFYFNHNTSYGPHFLGWPSSVYLQKERYQKMIEKVRNFKVDNMKVKRASFEEIMPKHKDDFLYCDPPYYIGENSKMFRGIYPMRNIPVHHKNFPHEALRNLLKNHKGGFILSYNNCPIIKEYYKEFQQSFPSWQYTMGQGETRIGKNRIENGDNHIKQSHEIIIFCPPKN